MKFQSNISILNALLRITCGFTLLTWSIAKMAKKPRKESYLLLAMIAGMKIGEGILRYCPIVDLMKQNESNTENALQPFISDGLSQMNEETTNKET